MTCSSSTARTSSGRGRTAGGRTAPALPGRLHEQLVTADLDPTITEVVLVLEGQAKAGVKKGRDGHVTVVHAPQDGDGEIVRQAHKAAEAGHQVTVVTADRLLAARVAKAGGTVGPSWLLDRLEN